MLDQPYLRTEIDWRIWQETAHPTIHNQLHVWLNLAKLSGPTLPTWRTCEMRERDIGVLVRDRTNGIPERCLAIATVQLPQQIQHNGWFKSFLTECVKANPWASLVIEDVENQHLRGFLQKLNCAVLSEFHTSSYVVNSATVLKLEAGPLLPYECYLNP